MEKIKRTLISGVLVMFCVPSVAEIRLNGFATVAAGMTTKEGHASYSEQSLYGYDDSLVFSEESLLGLQASADLDDGLEATVQIKAEGSDDWASKFEWAYLGYRINDNVKIIFGRQRQPYYLYSDYVDVGYAYHWITPPRGVYSLPFDSTDGVSALITNTFGDIESSLQIGTGRQKTTISFGGDTPIDTKKSIMFNWTLTYDWLSFRIGRSQSSLDLQIQGLGSGWTEIADGYEQAGGPAEVAANMRALGDSMGYAEETASFSGVGLTIDYGKFLFVAEATELDLTEGFIGESNSQYASLGYRVANNWMVHYTYGTNEDDVPEISTDGIPESPTGGTVPSLDQAVSQLLLGTQAVLSEVEDVESTYHTFGARWDFHSSAAMKFEFTVYKDELVYDNDRNVAIVAISTVF